MSRPAVDPRRRCLPIAQWPALDRKLWLERTAPNQDFTNPFPVWAAKTEEKNRQGYGRWLGFLRFLDRLDPQTPAGTRVTRELAMAYLRHMAGLDNRDYTIAGRLVELKSAMSILAPGEDFDWLTNPAGGSVRTLLPMRKRSFVIPPSDELYEWGKAMAMDALNLPGMCGAAPSSAMVS